MIRYQNDWNYISIARVDGGWSDWTSLGEMSLEANMTNQEETEVQGDCTYTATVEVRTCDNPEPAAGGGDCVGTYTPRS